MKPEIKQRIEQIKAGQVPAGYKRTKAGIMPCEWCSEKEYKAKDIFKSVTNKKHNGEFEVLSATQDKGVIPRSQVDIDIKFNEDNIVGYKKVDKGDFVISLRSFQGGIEYSEYEGLVSPAYTVLKPKIPICDGYYKAYLKTVDYISRLNKGTYGIRDGKQIGFEDFGDMIIHYPSLVEQEKIAEILSAQDKVIELKEKLLEEKKKQKKYLMQQLLTGKKRLPGFDTNWEKRLFRDCIEEVDERSTKNNQYPILSVTKEGITYQADHFNKQIASDNNVGYKIIRRNELAFSILNLWMGSVDVLKLCNIGIVSPAYKVFRCVTNNLIPSFAKFFLRSYNVVWLYNINSYTGASVVRKNLDLASLLDEELELPPIKEQIEIAKILSTVDQEIELCQKDLDQENQKKKALMQLLLTGIVRV